MPSVTQTILDPGTPKGNNLGTTLGSRNDSTLKNNYPNSPIYLGTYEDDERREIYMTLLASENVVAEVTSATYSTTLPMGTEGLGVSSFSTKYTGGALDERPPNFAEMALDTDSFGGGGGQATTPYIPPLGSTDTGDETGLAAWTGAATDLPAGGDQYGSGHNAPASPSDTSAKMDSAESTDSGTIGSYIKGRSYAGSAG